MGVGSTFRLQVPHKLGMGQGGDPGRRLRREGLMFFLAVLLFLGGIFVLRRPRAVSDLLGPYTRATEVSIARSGMDDAGVVALPREEAKELFDWAAGAQARWSNPYVNLIYLDPGNAVYHVAFVERGSQLTELKKVQFDENGFLYMEHAQYAILGDAPLEVSELLRRYFTEGAAANTPLLANDTA